MAKCGLSRGYRLPIEQLEQAAAAGLGRLVGDRGRGHRHAGLAQHHAGDRRRQPDGDHPLDKGPPRQSTGLNICNQISKFLFFYGAGSLQVLNPGHLPALLPPQKPGVMEMDQVRTTLSKQDPGHQSGHPGQRRPSVGRQRQRPRQCPCGGTGIRARLKSSSASSAGATSGQGTMPLHSLRVSHSSLGYFKPLQLGD
jgi:hypothetical protein